MRMVTTFLNPKQSDSSKGGLLVLSYGLESRATVGGAGPYDAFVEGKMVSTRMRDGIPTRSEQTMNARDSGNLSWLGSHVEDCPVRDHKVTQGQTVGQGHQFDVTILGNAQVRIQDLQVEIA